MRHPDFEIRGRPDHPDPETAEIRGGGGAWSARPLNWICHCFIKRNHVLGDMW